MEHEAQRTVRITQLERAIEEAMRPGDFIGYRQSWDFVRDIEEVAARVVKLIRRGHATDAVPLLETFIAASYEKAEEIDDSSGSYGMFVQTLFCDWVRARNAAKAPPEETAELLLAWMERDDHGFCYELERDLVKVLNRRGLRAFAAQVRARLDAAAPDDRGPTGFPRRRWTAALKSILAAQGDAEAFVALAEEGSLGSADCNVVAGIREARGAFEDALAWVERGLALAENERYSSATYELKKRQRALLLQLGRADEAIAAAWADFERAPGRCGYETLMELVPEAERAAWHDKAMDAADRGDLSSVIGLLVETREVDRLAARIGGAGGDQLERMSHSVSVPAAELLSEEHPAVAARVFCAQGLRIVNAGKSRYYDAALGYLLRARESFATAGLQQRWEAIVVEIRRAHGRKRSFMPGFERVAGGGPAAEPQPSFLERARSRWPRGGG
ncbi:MAG: DUF6880 family protein [Pseudomonadota bacterium]